MSETTIDTSADLSTFPTARDSVCPFDPPAEYAELRAQKGTASLACPVGVDARVVSRYADVRAMLGDPHLSSHAARPRTSWRAACSTGRWRPAAC